jgi:hypothetical protein
MAAMQQAIERNEMNHALDQISKDLEKQDHENTLAFEKHLLQQEKINKANYIKDYKESLDFQNAENQARVEQHYQEDAKGACDPFPAAPNQETAKLVKFTTTIKGMQSQKQKEDILDQIQENKERKIQHLAEERIQDKTDLADVDERIAREEEVKNQRAQATKESNARVWIE